MMEVGDYPLAVIRDCFIPSGEWKRGAKIVTNEVRNWCYLPDVRRYRREMMKWVEAGDAKAAQAYAERMGHFALLYLRGDP